VVEMVPISPNAWWPWTSAPFPLRPLSFSFERCAINYEVTLPAARRGLFSGLGAGSKGRDAGDSTAAAGKLHRRARADDRQVRWGDNSVSSCGFHSRAKGPGTSV
jgi:hypothetical protein